MSNTIRIKRRATGNAGAPSSLENAELAYNEVDDVLYYGKGTGGAGGTATTIQAIGGSGAYLTLSGTQTVTGNKTFSGVTIVPTPTANTHAATKLYVDNAVSSATISNTAVTAGSYGNANTVATFTVQSDGRLTAAGNTSISIASTAVTDFNEAAQDAVGTMITNGSQSGITVTYDDANAKVNFSVASQSFTLAGDTGTSQTITAGDTLTISGGVGLTATAGGATDKVVLDLDNTAVTAATYGNASTVASFTVDSQGRLTNAANTTISIAASQISDKGTNLVTGLTGTTNQITVSNSGVGAVTIALASNVTIPNDLVVTGDLTVQGNTVTLNTATLVVEDKNVVLANVATPTDTTADGAGLTVLGATNKTLNWVNGGANAWTASENFSLAASKAYYINGTSVLSNTTLGSGVIYSSLTTLGTIATGVWNGTAVGSTYGGTGFTSYTTGDLIYSSSGNTLSKLGIGSAGQFLKVVGGVPSWSDTVDGGTF